MKYDGCTSYKYQSDRAGKDGKNYIRSCPKFGEAIVQDGWSNFKYEVIEDGLTKEEAFEREKYWIEKDDCIWPKGYNIQTGSPQYPKHCIPHTEEAKRKMSESQKRRQRTPHFCSWAKRVQRFSLDGIFLAEYSSVSEASRITHIERRSISRCCDGDFTHAGDSIWKYSV